MNTKGTFILSLIAAGLLQALAVSAADLGPLPPARMQNGITYISGGVGKPESTAMKAAAGRHDLMLSFANRRSEFLADVKVNIADRNGATVLDIVSGPILLVDLPAGRYTVRADVDGHQMVKTVNVGGRHHSQLAYTWPNDAEERSEFAAFEIAPQPTLYLPGTLSIDTARYGGGLDRVSDGIWSSGFQNY